MYSCFARDNDSLIKVEGRWESGEAREATGLEIISKNAKAENFAKLINIFFPGILIIISNHLFEFVSVFVGSNKRISIFSLQVFIYLILIKAKKMRQPKKNRTEKKNTQREEINAN